MACIFGSVAQGKERSSSDVDVLVVGTSSFAAVVEALGAVHGSLGRPVNPVVMTMPAFKEKLAEGDRFVTRVAREPKIVLIGDGHEFG
jgi:predicted nucleotidyltransferase